MGSAELHEHSPNPRNDAEAQAREAAARDLLLRHYRRIAQWDPEAVADHALSIGDKADRLAELLAYPPRDSAPDLADWRVLVSGAGAGSEMLAARAAGFGEVHGVEVDPELVAVCQMRIAGMGGLHAHLYDGRRLPWSDSTFDLILSGHVIEHTAAPECYLAELMRVLKPAGRLALEFPSRYHRRELHTGLPSLEWLPRRLRNLSIEALAHPRSPLGADAKRRYRAILDSNLQQVSLRQVRAWLARGEGSWAVLGHSRPAPGVLRCVIGQPPPRGTPPRGFPAVHRHK